MLSEKLASASDDIAFVAVSASVSFGGPRLQYCSKEKTWKAVQHTRVGTSRELFVSDVPVKEKTYGKTMNFIYAAYVAPVSLLPVSSEDFSWKKGQIGDFSQYSYCG